MKPVRKEKFKLTSAMARNIAEQIWGKGGTVAYKTTRTGAYYFSCSGHGGYVVDGQCLSSIEQSAIAKKVPSRHLQTLVQHQPQGDVIIGVSSPYTRKLQRFRYRIRSGPVKWEKYPVFIFEEDCDWKILEDHTDIRRMEVST